MINVLLRIKRYTGNYPLLNEMIKLDPRRFRVVVCCMDGRNDGKNSLDQLVSHSYYLETPNVRIRPSGLALLRCLRDIIDRKKSIWPTVICFA